MKSEKYVIVYPNDPDYKGTDAFYKNTKTLVGSLADAKFFLTKKEATFILKKMKNKKGYLKPEIEKVQVNLF